MPDYIFTVMGGETVVDGKSIYPHYVSIKMDRRRAIAIAHSLLNQLGDEGNVEIKLPLLGQVEETREDDEA